jgi:hypothetical protein
LGGTQGSLLDLAPDTPISFLPNKAFVAQMCALLGRNERNDSPLIALWGTTLIYRKEPLLRKNQINQKKMNIFMFP